MSRRPSIAAYQKAAKVVRLRTKVLENLNKSQEETKKAMLNVMEDLEQAKAIIEIEKAKAEAMLASIGEGLIAVSNNREVLIINKSAEGMLGWNAKDLVGKKLTHLPLEDDKGSPLRLDKRPIYLAITTGKTIDDNYFFVREDKTKFPIAIISTPIKLNGKIIGAIIICRDITKEKEIDKAKSQFVSFASHQLRTPLGIIKWYLEALENEDCFKRIPKAIREYFDEIYRSNERLLSMVRDLLSVSRIEQGEVKDIPKPVDPVQMIKEITAQMQIVARKKKITLNLAVKNQKIASINIDIIRFREVIENLIVNAIEYSRDGSSVKVAIQKVGNTLLILVKDAGIGVSAVDQKKLFTKFFRTEKAVIFNPEGAGLGLYVVKSYVESWGGKISVESTEEKGSTFTVSLPISKKLHEGR